MEDQPPKMNVQLIARISELNVIPCLDHRTDNRGEFRYTMLLGRV